jgi:glucosamine kinase
MPFFLALDAGGTKTQCWVADDTRILASLTTGTVKLMNVGEGEATTRLRSLIESALDQAAVPAASITRTAMGLAGVSSEIVREWARHTVTATVGGEFLLSGDEDIALDAAFESHAGILVIAGTGSNVVGRCSDGTKHSAGGWGPVLGDEGSGYWIGLEAIRSALRAHDRGVPTCLLREIESFWSLSSLGELVALANDRSRPDFAGLTTVVAACADSGDLLAAGVLDRAGRELAEAVGLVASRMHAAGCDRTDAAHIAFTGSVLGKITRVRQAFTEALLAALPSATIAAEPVEPLAGALWRARRG